MPERFAKIVGLRLHLLEQPHISDGDHRLIRKSLQHADLLVSEGMHLVAAEHDRADALLLAQERHAQNAAVAHAQRQFAAVGELGIGLVLQILDVHRLLVDEGAARGPAPVDRPFLQPDRDRTMMRIEAKIVAVAEQHGCVIGIAQRDQALTMAFSAGSTSVGEEAITFRMLAVAVCRSSASLVSLNSRHSRWRSPPGRQRSGAARWFDRYSRTDRPSSG